VTLLFVCLGLYAFAAAAVCRRLERFVKEPEWIDLRTGRPWDGPLPIEAFLPPPPEYRSDVIDAEAVDA
jgi:hypothetical protein